MTTREVWCREVDGEPAEVAATRAELGDASYGKVCRYVPAEPPTGEVLERHRETALLAVFPATGADSPLRKWVTGEKSDLPARSGSLTLQAAERVAVALASAEQAGFAAGRASGGERDVGSLRRPGAPRRRGEGGTSSGKRRHCSRSYRNWRTRSARLVVIAIRAPT